MLHLTRAAILVSRGIKMLQRSRQVNFCVRPYGKNNQPRTKTSGERAFGLFVGENFGRKVSVERGELAANSRAHGSPAQRITRFGERKHAASKSGRLPMIIFEQATQPFAAENFPGLLARLGPWLQDLMVQPLMRAFPVIIDRKSTRLNSSH